MTLVTVGQIEEKQSQRGLYHRVELKRAEGGTVWANLWDANLLPLFRNGGSLEVELETNDRGFTRVVTARAAGSNGHAPAAGGVAGEPDATTMRIYRCSALGAAVQLMDGIITSAALGQEHDRFVNATLRAADAFYGWLLNAGDEDDGPDDEAEAF